MSKEYSFNLSKLFDKVIIEAAKQLESFDESFESQIRVADERFGDFQANGVLPLQGKEDLTQEKSLRS